jgi:catechol 2,3-dioxygenase-like lactoylglutathione lyase family enzyme
VANGRRPITPLRGLTAAVLGVLAVFVASAGAGMQSWAIVALGAALGILAISMIVVPSVRGGERAYVAGTAHVVTVSEAPASSLYGRCELQIVVDAPGIPPAAVKIRDPRVPVSKWPDLGATLPIMVAVDDPRRVRILWDDVQTHAEAAAEESFPGYGGERADDLADEDPLDIPMDAPAPVDLLDPMEEAEPATTDLTDDLADLRDLTNDLPDLTGDLADPPHLRDPPGRGPKATGPEPEPEQRADPPPPPRGPSPAWVDLDNAEPQTATAASSAADSGVPRPRPRPRPHRPSGPTASKTPAGRAADEAGAAAAGAAAGFATATAVAEPGVITDDEPPPDETPPPTAGEPVRSENDETARTVVGETGGAIASETAWPTVDETARGEAAPVTTAPGDAARTKASETSRPAGSETARGEAASDKTDPGETARPTAGETGHSETARPAAGETAYSGTAYSGTARPAGGEGDRGEAGRPAAGNGARSGAVGRPGIPTTRRPEGALQDREAAPRQGVPLRPEAAPEVLFEAVAGAAPAAFIKPTAFPERTIVPEPRAAAEQAPAQAFNDGHAATREQDDMPTARVTAIELDLGDLITAYPSARPGPAGSIHGVGITMLVTDLTRSIAFYRDMLGFAEIDSGDGNAVLASGDTRIVLRSARDVPRVNRRLVHLNLEVGDVNAVYQELRSKGVRFTYPPRAANRGERLELWAAAFRDPDGHGIAITQWRNRTD